MNWPDQKRLHLLLRIIFLVNLLFLGYLYPIVFIVKSDIMANPPMNDFLRYWAASALTIYGEAAAAYSLPKLQAVGKTIGSWDIPSVAPYPPTFLLMTLPLALLPYQLSLLVWCAVTLAGYLLLMRFIAPHSLTPWLFLGFPAVFLNLIYGQNGFLSTVLLGAGLFLMERHPLSGGFVLGILSYKPQLALLIALALMAGQHWRALGGLLLATAGLALASLWLFGQETWIAFWGSISGVVTYADDFQHWRKMPTIYAAARLAGASFPGAMMLQGIASAAAIGAVTWIWFRGAPLALRVSVLTLGTLLATPYAFEYDLALLSLPFAWLGWEEYLKGRLTGQSFLIFCWIIFYLNFVEKINFQVTPLILLALFFFVLYRYKRAEGGQQESY